MHRGKEQDWEDLKYFLNNIVTFFFIIHIPFFQQRVRSLIETATYNYIMKPSSTGVLITEATVEEVHQFSPFNEIHGAAQMEAKYD